ncbi:MAG: hypothetical protein CMO81_00425 [Waddliaceae bacterium]|nr:hypothetical protein [Waddliaceae bacterium]
MTFLAQQNLSDFSQSDQVICSFLQYAEKKIDQYVGDEKEVQELAYNVAKQFLGEIAEADSLSLDERKILLAHSLDYSAESLISGGSGMGLFLATMYLTSMISIDFLSGLGGVAATAFSLGLFDKFSQRGMAVADESGFSKLKWMKMVRIHDTASDNMGLERYCFPNFRQFQAYASALASMSAIAAQSERLINPKGIVLLLIGNDQVDFNGTHYLIVTPKDKGSLHFALEKIAQDHILSVHRFSTEENFKRHLKDLSLRHLNVNLKQVWIAAHCLATEMLLGSETLLKCDSSDTRDLQSISKIIAKYLAPKALIVTTGCNAGLKRDENKVNIAQALLIELVRSYQKIHGSEEEEDFYLGMVACQASLAASRFFEFAYRENDLELWYEAHRSDGLVNEGGQICYTYFDSEENIVVKQFTQSILIEQYLD